MYIHINQGSSHDETIKSTLKYYLQVLTYLISHGAMLSSVKPEFLLSKEDFKRYVNISQVNVRLPRIRDFGNLSHQNLVKSL
jgi:hypothetical protein